MAGVGAKCRVGGPGSAAKGNASKGSKALHPLALHHWAVPAQVRSGPRFGPGRGSVRAKVRSGPRRPCLPPHPPPQAGEGPSRRQTVPLKCRSGLERVPAPRREESSQNRSTDGPDRARRAATGRKGHAVALPCSLAFRGARSRAAVRGGRCREYRKRANGLEPLPPYCAGHSGFSPQVLWHTPRCPMPQPAVDDHVPRTDSTPRKIQSPARRLRQPGHGKISISARPETSAPGRESLTDRERTPAPGWHRRFRRPRSRAPGEPRPPPHRRSGRPARR